MFWKLFVSLWFCMFVVLYVCGFVRLFIRFFLQNQITDQDPKGLKIFLPSASVLWNKMGQKYYVMPGNWRDIVFLLKLLSSGIFLGLAQFPEFFFCTIFFSIKKKLPNLLQW